MRNITALSVIIVVVLLLLSDVDARGGRGGGRSSSGSRGSRGGSSGTSRTSGGSRSTGRRITRTTPITPTTFRTPVIKAQTRSVSRTKLFTKFAAGYLVTRYILLNAPVYRDGFPVHGSYVSIPEDRAVRVSTERVRLLDSNGSLCLGLSPINQTLEEGIENRLLKLETTVKYKDSPQKDETLFGVNNTVSLWDIKEKNFTVTTRARYNVTVLQDTNCTQVETQFNGTMVQLYEFNPNTGSILGLNLKLILTSFLMTTIFISFNKA